MKCVSGLYAITPETRDTTVLSQKVSRAITGGARLVQYRAKTGDTILRRRQAEELLGLCRGARIPFIVNDDLELALAIGADGLHIGRDDGDLAVARAKLSKDKLLGVSCYAELGLAANAVKCGADYLAFGSAFPSSTKPGTTRASVRLYREARKRFSLPIVAIGGVTPDNATPLLEAGVDALAAIGALFDVPDVEAAARKFTRLFGQGRRP